MKKESGYIRLTYEFYKENNKWVAICNELGTSTFGRSILDAERKLDEAVMLHLDTLEEVGERERFFQEHNISLLRTKAKIGEMCVFPNREDAYFKPRFQPVGDLLPF
jgi:predicted RNase H-like HicB family nuclease